MKPIEESLREWVEERLLNCCRIAETKVGKDRDGWIQDANHFRQILTLLSAQPAPVEAGDTERAQHYLRAGGPHDAANSTEEAANLLAVELAAAFKRGFAEGVESATKS